MLEVLNHTVKCNIYLQSTFMISSLHIKLARTSLGLTQEEVAKRSSVSLPTIKKIEVTNPNQEIKSNRSTIIALMKFFEDCGASFINEEDYVGVKVKRAVVKKKFK